MVKGELDGFCLAKRYSGRGQCYILKRPQTHMTPPRDEPYLMHNMYFASARDLKGSSIKSGNIRLNMKKLVKSLPELTASVVSVANDIPILKVCAALVVWKTLRKVMTIEISGIHAAVVIGLWNNCDHDHLITLERGFDCVNALCRNLPRPELNWEEYIRALEDLEKNHNLKLTDNGIWLCEWVSNKYR